MKGFPNQVVDLAKLTRAWAIVAKLIVDGKGLADSTVGEALVRGGIIGPRRSKGKAAPGIEEYLAEQKKKSRQNRSHEASARGLTELFGLLGLMDVDGLTDKGKRIAATPPGAGLSVLRDAWRPVIRNMSHHGNYGGTSHPYQVLLRLVARRPGISRARCALALEAKNDSDAELDRIVEISNLKNEETICALIKVSKSNWDNAKKCLPSFAEQLGDVNKIGGSFYLASSPGTGEETGELPKPSPKKPATARKVTAATIANTRTVESFDEAEGIVAPTAEELAATKAKIAKRLERHNNLVRKVAAIFEAKGGELFEFPFDCLAGFADVSLLVEVKSLDGTEADESIRVREALGQLLYYEAFATAPYTKKTPIIRVALFEGPISRPHLNWFKDSDIHCVWVQDGKLTASKDSVAVLKPYLGEMAAS